MNPLSAHMVSAPSPPAFIEATQARRLLWSLSQSSQDNWWAGAVRDAVTSILVASDSVIDSLSLLLAARDVSSRNLAPLNRLLGLFAFFGNGDELEDCFLPGGLVCYRQIPQGLPESGIITGFAESGAFGSRMDVCPLDPQGAPQDLHVCDTSTIERSSICLSPPAALPKIIKDVIMENTQFINCSLRILSLTEPSDSSHKVALESTAASKNKEDATVGCRLSSLAFKLKTLCLSSLDTFVVSISQNDVAEVNDAAEMVAAYSVLIDVWPVLLVELVRNAMELGLPLSAVPPTSTSDVVQALSKVVADGRARITAAAISYPASLLTAPAVSASDVLSLVELLSQLPLYSSSMYDKLSDSRFSVGLSKIFVESLTTSVVPMMYTVDSDVAVVESTSGCLLSPSSAPTIFESASVVATSSKLNTTTFSVNEVTASPMQLRAHLAECFLESLRWHTVSVLYRLLCDILMKWPKSLSLFNTDQSLSSREIGTLLLLFKVAGMEESAPNGAPVSTPLLKAIVVGPSNLSGTTKTSSVSAFGNCLIDMCCGLLKRIFSCGDEEEIAGYVSSISTSSVITPRDLSQFAKPSLLLALRLFDLILGFNSSMHGQAGESTMFIRSPQAGSILTSILQALNHFHLLPAKFSKYLLALIGRSLWQAHQHSVTAVSQGTIGLLRAIASAIISIAREACSEYSKVPSKGYISDVYQSLLQTAIMSSDLFTLTLFDKEIEVDKIAKDPWMASVTIESSHPITAGKDIYSRVSPQGVPNRTGVPTAAGTGSTADMLYCGRRLGRDVIPGSDGRCGPNNGPQCADCKGLTVSTNPVVGWMISFDSQTTLAAGCDHVTFYKDKSHMSYWGEARYCTYDGLPGVGPNAPLIIDAPTFEVYFHSAEGAMRSTTGPLRVGDRVQLAAGFESIEDAASGPLSGLQSGEIFEDDGSSKPFNVRCMDGRTWWYCAAALKRMESPPTTPVVVAERLSVGDRVLLSEDFATMGDACSGPLRVGDFGIIMKDDRSSKPFQVRAETGAKVGKTWWYAETAVVRAPTDAVPTRRLAIGERVLLTGIYASAGDASSGPLKPGDIGIVLKDDRSSKPFQIKAETGARTGATWWYVEGALKRAETSSVLPAGASSASAVSAASAAIRSATAASRLVIGDEVVVSPEFAQCGDAANGPLAFGDVGVITEDDGSSKPFRVRSQSGANIGKLWWYETAAVRRRSTVTTPHDMPVIVGDKVVLNNEYSSSAAAEASVVSLEGHVGNIINIDAQMKCLIKIEDGPNTGTTVSYPARFLCKYSSPSQLVLVQSTVAGGVGNRLTVGESVILSRNYNSQGDAKDGPLKPGDVGKVVKDDRSSKPYQVIAETGNSIGSTWWYVEGAVTRASTAVPGTDSAAARLTVGEMVVLATDFRLAGDASNGPLSIGDIGVVVKDDSSLKPFQVKVETGSQRGSTWWYAESALRKAPAPQESNRAEAKSGRLTVGEAVMVSSGYASCGDAKGGPLVPGDVGILVKDDNSSKPFQVKAQTGSKIGATWWYAENAVTRANVTPRIGSSGRLQTGERVSLTSGAPSMGDAGGGPLKPGDVGILLKDDGSSKPYQVRAETGEKVGTTWWYADGALMRAEAPPPPSAPPAPAIPANRNSSGISRLSIGDRVKLSSEYNLCGDATDGPLSVQDTGILVKDDRSSKPFQVRAETGLKAGTFWWYEERALSRAATASDLVAAGTALAVETYVPNRAPAIGDTCERNPLQWTWAEQDGGAGNRGRITQLPINGWLEVLWDANGGRNKYRWNTELSKFDILLVGDALPPPEAVIAGDASMPWGYRIVATPFDSAYVPETRILESSHPYLDNQNIYQVIETFGATSYRVTFDAQSCFENGCDYVRFYKDSTHSAHWGDSKYTGGRNGSVKNMPGVNGIPSLIIPAPSFVFHFHSDGKNSFCFTWPG
jgi:hypothetical protein